MFLQNITNKIKNTVFVRKMLNRPEVSDFPDFNTDDFVDISINSTAYTDIEINEFIQIPLFVVGTNGIFIFIRTNTEEMKVIEAGIKDIKRRYDLNYRGVFLFVSSPEKDYVNVGAQTVTIEYKLDVYSALYHLTGLPQTALREAGISNDIDFLEKAIEQTEFSEESTNRYVKPLIAQSSIDLLTIKLEKRSTEKKGLYYTDEDGIKYIRRNVATKHFGYMYDTAYYPVAEDDPNQFLLIAVFGGLFGLHKFKAGEYGKGILYLLTCGGMGVFYLMDILNLLTGNYCIVQDFYNNDENGNITKEKHRIYLDRVHFNGLIRCGVMGLSAVFAVFAVKFGYINALKLVNEQMDQQVKAAVEAEYGEYDNINNLLEVR